MSQTSREQQKENALILRNETRKGRNTKTRVYNLINDLVDSAVMYDQIVQTGGTGTTKIVSQAGLNDYVGLIKATEHNDAVRAIKSNVDIVGEGLVTLTNGSATVLGNGTNFLDATTGLGLSYWYSMHVVDSNNVSYRIDLSSFQSATQATILEVFSERQLLAGGAIISTGNNIFTGATGTYPFKIVTNTARGLFSISFGNKSYATNFGTAFGGSSIANGQTSFACGFFSQASGAQSFAMGMQTLASGNKSFAGGWGSVGTGFDKRIKASGEASFNFSVNTTFQTLGHGALGARTAILGGQDHNIPANAPWSAILGGRGIKVGSGVQYTAHFPKIRFGLGTGATTVTNNSNDNVLVRNPSTGEIEIRQASTIGSVGSFWKTTGSTSLSSDVTVENTFGSLIFLNDGSSEVDAGIRAKTDGIVGIYANTGTSWYGLKIESWANEFNIKAPNGNTLKFNDSGIGTDAPILFTGTITTGSSGQALVNKNYVLEAKTYSFGRHMFSPRKQGGDGVVGLNVGRITSDIGIAATIGGDIWYNTTDGVFRVSTGTEIKTLAYVSDITGGSSSNQVGLDLVTSSSITATTDSHYIHYSGSTAGNIYLPASPKDRQQIVVSDAKGNAFTNNITVYGNGKTINGNSTALIDSNYGTLLFVYNGFNWIGSGFIS